MSNPISSRCFDRHSRYGACVDRWLFHPTVGATLALLTVLIILGCMSHTHYHATEGVTSPEGTYTQIGEVSLPKSAEQVVYYPVPYATTPNLELGKDQEWCQLMEQHPDHFKIRNNYRSGNSVITWKARGVRTPPPTPPVEAVVVPPPGAAKLAPPNGVPPPPTPFVPGQ